MMLPFWEASPELMLWAPTHFWLHLVGVLGEEKIYLGSSIIMKIYPTVSLVIRGWDGVDGGRPQWMMF